jgi:protein-tyrosine kinase
MSRIHEALKKAEQERAATLSTGERTESTVVVADIRATVVPPKRVTEETLRDIPATEGSPALRFEDFVKRCAHPQWMPDPAFNLSRSEDDGKVGAERFRTLRSRLYQIAGTRPLRRILVTSSLPAEGKTFVAANLARSIVQQIDGRVLLIDADLRAPRLHTALGAPSTPGLSDYLRGETDEYGVIQNNLESNLCFIPCGNKVANPSELLLSERMKKLLDRVTPVFEWVILDSPPSLPVHDANNLADLCDGVLFVVRAGETSHESARKASSEFLKKKLLGVVLNRVEKDATSYGAYNYGYGHDREDADKR